MPEHQASERDIMLIDEVLNDGRKALAQGQAGVAALLASPYEIIGRGRAGEDTNLEEMVVRDLTLPRINQQLVRGPFILVPGVRRSEGQTLLREMNKAAGAPPDLKT